MLGKLNIKFHVSQNLLMKDNQKLLSNCEIVKGYLRDSIYDLQYEEYFFIPQSLTHYINGELKSDENINEIIQAYKHFLNENNLLNSYYENENEFPKMDYTWRSYEIIQNVISISDKVDYKIFEIVKYLKSSSLVLIYKNVIQIKDCEKIIKCIEQNESLKQVRLVFQCNQNLDLYKLFEFSFKVSDIIIYGCLLEEIVKIHNIKIVKTISKSFNGFEDLNFPIYMSVSQKLYTESQSRHTYFNQKLFIDSDGSIKNAPESSELHGNINDLIFLDRILNVVNTDSFQKHWKVTKDSTDICKDCEFRHMCIDNRLPHQRNQSEWFHKKECNYNPYIAKWSGEEGYRSLSECGVISNEHEFSIDHEKIAQINLELWGED